MKLRNKETGEVVEADYISVARSGFDIKDKDGNTIAKDIRTLPLCYLSVRELTSEFEDYEPKEPIIKDEKIRKALRAWAEVNSVKEAIYAERQDRSLCVLEDMGEGDYSIDLVGWIPTLKDGEVYTIAELCGEEEA